ncbi:UNVERIFIED_CONTAM: hypothetical protein Sradi_3591400 [Sesamum radiatum]|uniref:Uncharacterized protein n=1 Tax=Sesamum radiatum TaxID=300843 RepID=A0AAW2QIG2_SESRA
MSLGKSYGNVTMVHTMVLTRWRNTLRTPEETPKQGEGSTGIHPVFFEGEEEQGGTRELQVQLSVPGNVVRRIRSTEVHGRIPTRRNGKGKFLHHYLSKNYD